MSENTNIAAVTEQHGLPPVIPTDVFNINIFRACNRIAEVMASANLVPKHLNNQHADCFIIAQQSYRWGVDPFAVAQCTAIVSGKLCYEGKLVAAIVEKLAGVTLNYEYSGAGDLRAVKVIGKRKSDDKPVDISITVKDVKTANEKWRTMTDQMLAYRGSREWARRYTPGVLLGIYTDDEMPAEPAATMKNVTPTLDAFEAQHAVDAEVITPQDVTPRPAQAETATITVNIGTGVQATSYADAAEKLIGHLKRYVGADERSKTLADNKDLITAIRESGLGEKAMEIASYYAPNVN